MSLYATAYGWALRCTGRAAWTEIAAGHNPLLTLEADLLRRHPSVTALAPKDVAAGCLLFDVRATDEYRVSHLAGAVHLSSHATIYEVLRAANSQNLIGTTAIFYCAVGVRSARLIDRLQSRLLDSGCARVANLSGGIFRWHNEGRQLFDATGPVNHVHPYNDHWRCFLMPQTATVQV